MDSTFNIRYSTLCALDKNKQSKNKIQIFNTLQQKL